MNIENILNKELIKIFLDKVFLNLKKDNINTINYELDHICYRVSTQENYELLKKELLKSQELLAENIISGRVISTFKLTNPIIYNDRKIYILEVPSPKDGSNYIDGFDHIEFVINESFEEFIKKYPHIHFDIKDINKNINPDIRIKYDDFSVKFHHNSLEYVIKNFE